MCRELEVMGVCVEALKTLDTEEQLRAMEYLQSRFNTKELRSKLFNEWRTLQSGDQSNVKE